MPDGFETLPDSFEPPYPEQGPKPICTAINQALDPSSTVGWSLAIFWQEPQVDETGQVQYVLFDIPASEER